MQLGQIFVANSDGVNVIKMIGDVRLTLCISFNNFIESMFSDSAFKSVMFDLRKAEALDSTTLGLMAKIAIKCQEQYQQLPLIISPNDGINRVLESMGLEEIFEIVRSIDTELPESNELPTVEASLTHARDKVLEAHRILMSLNDNNKDEFRDLVACLEQE